MSYIPKECWHTCKICNKKIQELAKIYGGCGIYYSQVFIKHLKIDHNINIEQYLLQYCNIPRPPCPCGVCNKRCKISCKSTIKFYKYACGRNPGQKKWSEEAKTTRLGSNNPMYGKKTWNTGLTKETNEILRKNSEKAKNRPVSLETRKKLSDAIKRRIPPHLGHKHSEITKEKSRIRTLNMIHNGFFKQLKSKPHKMFAILLHELKIEYTEEYICGAWCFDFFLPNYNIFIEVDGDYFHSNPKFYPNGPKTKTQKINWYRDIKKNQFCTENKISCIRYWECDIINNIDIIKEDLLCRLKK